MVTDRTFAKALRSCWKSIFFDAAAIGLLAFCYTTVHLLVYVVLDLQLDRGSVLADIQTHLYDCRNARLWLACSARRHFHKRHYTAEGRPGFGQTSSPCLCGIV